LFRKADATAKELGLSRSGLFALALEEYLNDRRPRRIIENLNKVYSNESSGLDRGVAAMQSQTLSETDW
jgi:metal-responsive CopG/Arc/MetJ family transcriptional regulator